MAVSLVTTMPETSVTWGALRLGSEEMALANVYGSCAFNVLVLGFSDLLYARPIFQVLDRSHIMAGLGALALMVLGPAFLSLRVRGKLNPSRVLGAAVGDWRTDTHRIHYREQPDAYWYSRLGPFAIEYDAGSYSLGLLQRKVQTFALRFVGQYWGAPTERKAASLRERLAPFGLDGRFVLAAPWW